MLSAGVRLALVVVAPLVGAALAHELRRRPAASVGAALAAVAAALALVLSVAGGVAGGGSLEHTFGNALPGVDLTARGDSASVGAVLLACLAALPAVFRRRREPERVAGVLLCLSGGTAVAVGGNLVLGAAGVLLVAGGTLLARGRRGAGSRSTRILATMFGAAGLALVAAAAQMVAGAGSSDLASVPPTVIGGAVAVPWALAGAALLLGAAGPVGAGAGDDWAAVAALPCGYLVLLRLQESAGGQLPGVASVTLGMVGAAGALLAAAAALRAVSTPAAGRAILGILAGVLVSLFGGSLQGSGVLLGGLFLAIEVGLLAAPAWTARPAGWSVAAVATLALPGGAALATVAVGLGAVAHRGAGGFPQLVAIAAALAAAAVAAARRLAVVGGPWRPVLPWALAAAAAGMAGGVVPGLALRQLAAPFAGGAAAVDLDAGALQVPGAGFAAGYVAVAAAIVLLAAGAAAVIAAGEPVAAPSASPAPARPRSLALLLTGRRVSLPAARRLARGLDDVDHWLEGQPRLPLFLGAAAAAVLLLR